MTSTSFDYLLELVHDDLLQQTTKFRKPIAPAERLLITLRFLATGNSYTSLHYEFRVGISTIQKIVITTCRVLWSKLQPKHMVFPDREKWIEIADNFWVKHKFPNCIGAVDGKHIRLICPPCSGSKYHNYKKFFSITLMAVVDADYRFTYIDVGNYGSSNDASIFERCKLGMRLRDGQLDLPAPRPWPGTNDPQPFTFVADEGFGLSVNVMRPYSQKNMDDAKHTFNTRLTIARRVVECSFGILANKWRVLHIAMQLHPDNAVVVVKVACVLHNFLRDKEGGIVTETLEQPFTNISGNVPRGSSSALNLRDQLKVFFVRGRSGQ
ncbi:uncharacterized protein [Hyperolius riggenbachi]|uniref:uncharacterized protein n=1 Tax=Hyperolius riggenbachi TaxID=752182 RepID=UPI0035A3CF0B